MTRKKIATSHVQGDQAQENRKRSDLIGDAIDSGDFASIQPLMDAQHYETFVNDMAMIKTAFPDYHGNNLSTVADGAFVAHRFEAQGTHQGTFMGIAPTGKQIHFKGLSLDQFADGKLLDSWVEVDILSIFEQMGQPFPQEHTPTEMHERTTDDFTIEQLFGQAQGNSNALILGTLAYFKEHTQPPESWIASLGKMFASGWTSMPHKGVLNASELLARNFCSCGGHLHAHSGDTHHAEVVITDWPQEDVLHIFGLTREEVDPFFNVFAPIAEALQMHYTWQRQGQQVTFQFSQ